MTTAKLETNTVRICVRCWNVLTNIGKVKKKQFRFKDDGKSTKKYLPTSRGSAHKGPVIPHLRQVF